MPKHQPTKDEMYAFKRSILSYLRQHPESSHRDVADGLKSELKRVVNSMREMEQNGLITHRQPRGDRKYFYRNLRGAFKYLADQYGQPYYYVPSNLRNFKSLADDPAKKVSSDEEAKPNASTTTVKTIVSVSVEGVQYLRDLDLDTIKKIYAEIGSVINANL